ncbi:MAG: hypothetical protein KME60_18620 [Cyanomargarita calcarea GSE-NOS-MK-12-04C]|jgi:hypothetical protein|uniref:Uncharacterized protein n=1 Tax=Cyanomargarita calcarea GSE-NOS-MK-12-04C TaxID=2839659 RepID=A0A951UU37_9CYAN|nr:hypothetical protein [Cyanomargarita calcarea GSE-NOS-MK-12-04C]
MVKRGVMVKQASLQSNRVARFEDRKLALDDFNVDPVSRIQTPWGIDADMESVPKCVYLKLEDLKCFETVERQYESWGVIFNNCIAIQPSNPAFPPHSGLVVLMGSPKSGLLEATFVNPVAIVDAFVTSSQPLVLSAYDRDRQLVAKTILPAANLANSDSVEPPNVLLSVRANEIHRVTFCAFDGQFTVDDFSFCLM